MSASWISTGTPSKLSLALPFPLYFLWEPPDPDTTREFNGARTKEIGRAHV